QLAPGTEGGVYRMDVLAQMTLTGLPGQMPKDAVLDHLESARGVGHALARLSHFRGIPSANPFRFSKASSKVFTTGRADGRPRARSMKPPDRKSTRLNSS